MASRLVIGFLGFLLRCAFFALGPPRAERLRGELRKLATGSPPGERPQRELLSLRPPWPDGMCGAGGGVEDAWRAGGYRPRAHPGEPRQRRMPLDDQIPPQVEQHSWQVDVDRADFLTLAAQAAGVWQRRRFLQSGHQRRENRADRPRIHPAIGVPADRLINRAGVHARPTADAPQHLGILRLVDRAASILYQNDV